MILHTGTSLVGWKAYRYFLPVKYHAGMSLGQYRLEYIPDYLRTSTSGPCIIVGAYSNRQGHRKRLADPVAAGPIICDKHVFLCSNHINFPDCKNKITCSKFVATRWSDFKAKMHQIRFPLGLCPRPCWGSLQCSPDP